MARLHLAPKNVFATWGIHPIGMTRLGDHNHSMTANELPPKTKGST
jgi:hypothetical protein